MALKRPRAAAFRRLAALVARGVRPGFGYIERQSHEPKKNATLKASHQDHLDALQKTWNAYEGFVMLGCIALGTLQLIALQFDAYIWSTFTHIYPFRRRHCSFLIVRGIVCITRCDSKVKLHGTGPY